MIDESALIDAIVRRYLAATPARSHIRSAAWVATDLRAAHATRPLRLADMLMNATDEELVAEVDAIILHVYHGSEFGGRMVRDWRSRFTAAAATPEHA